MSEERPKVGVGVFVYKDGKFLIQKRKGVHGSGTWCLPGGHLEFKEELEDCARREVMEEAGISIKNIKFYTITNDIFKEERKHYVTIFMVSDYDSGEIRIMEPEKCYAWEWVDKLTLPSPLFIPMQNLIDKGMLPK